MLVLLTTLAASFAANADIRPLLQHQGFYAPINGRETIKYVGHIRQGRNDYQVYTYHGVFRAAVVDHGVSDLIIMVNGSTLVGSYKIAMPTDCKVRGQKVVCNAGVVQFTKRGPPREIWFDGEVDKIELGTKLKK